MIARFIEIALHNRPLVLLAAALLVVAGVRAVKDLPIDAVPDITSPQIQINVEVPGIAPEEIEKLVTYVIESELGGLPGASDMRSLTKTGLSQVTLEFEDGVDIYRARQLAVERLQNVKQRLPRGVEPKLAPITTGLGEVFYYALEPGAGFAADERERYEQLLELTAIQEYEIKPRLRTVPGIAEVNASGGYDRQLVVAPDPDKLREANVTFDELAAVIEANSQNSGGGFVNRGKERLTIRALTRARSAEEILALPVKFGGAVRPILVRDLASVSTGHEPRYGAATFDGVETVIGATMMTAGENSRVIARRVDERVARINRDLAPGVVARPVYDRADLVDRSIATVRRNLLEGAVLVTVILFVLLGNWRAALIVASVIPLSFLFALVGMSRLGVSGNLMSLGAVDFGLIIDGAVVIAENVVRQLGEHEAREGRPLTRPERFGVVLAASRQVATPIFFGVMIIGVVYVPILALVGIEGKMFHPMAITVMIALGGALVLALTLVPTLCAMWLGSRGPATHAREDGTALMRAVSRAYAPLLDLALRRRAAIVLAALTLSVLAAAVFTRLGAEFVPKLDEGSTTMMIYHPVGLSLEESLARQLRTDAMVRERFPEVARVFSRIGTSEVATDPMPPNETDFYVSYRPRSRWRMVDGRIPTKLDLARRIAAEIEKDYPDSHVLVAQPIEMRFNEMLEGVRADVSVKVFGDDFDVLERLAGEIRAILQGIPGSAEVEHETDGRVSTLTIALSREALARYNLPAAAVNAAIETALAGRTVGRMTTRSRPHDVVVRLREDRREQLETLRRLPIRVGEHGLLALGDVASFSTVEAVEPIRRDAGRRRAALMVNLATRDVEGWVGRAEGAIREQVKMPDGYRLAFGGQFERLREARARLAVVVPAALALIFILIFIAFGSLRQALLVYTGIPLAATGGVLALFARQMPFSITAAVGFIALSGVAVLNGVVLVSYFNELRQRGRSVRQAVVEGAAVRLRPVVMTALVASLGFLPMAVSMSAGAEVQRPLATVVIGGILSSTFLTLLLLPVLYDWVEAGANGERESRAA